MMAVDPIMACESRLELIFYEEVEEGAVDDGEMGVAEVETALEEVDLAREIGQTGVTGIA